MNGVEKKKLLRRNDAATAQTEESGELGEAMNEKWNDEKKKIMMASERRFTKSQPIDNAFENKNLADSIFPHTYMYIRYLLWLWAGKMQMWKSHNSFALVAPASRLTAVAFAVADVEIWDLKDIMRRIF